MLDAKARRRRYAGRLNEIDRAINGESARWGDNRFPNDPYTAQDWLDVNVDNSTGDLKAVVPDFFPVRTSVLLDQFDAAGWIPSLDAPLLQPIRRARFPLASSSRCRSRLASPAAATIYYTTDGSDPRLQGGGLKPAAASLHRADHAQRLDAGEGPHLFQQQRHRERLEPDRRPRRSCWISRSPCGSSRCITIRPIIRA